MVQIVDDRFERCVALEKHFVTEVVPLELIIPRCTLFTRWAPMVYTLDRLRPQDLEKAMAYIRAIIAAVQPDFVTVVMESETWNWKEGMPESKHDSVQIIVESIDGRKERTTALIHHGRRLGPWETVHNWEGVFANLYSR